MSKGAAFVALPPTHRGQRDPKGQKKCANSWPPAHPQTYNMLPTKDAKTATPRTLELQNNIKKKKQKTCITSHTSRKVSIHHRDVMMFLDVEHHHTRTQKEHRKEAPECRPPSVECPVCGPHDSCWNVMEYSTKSSCHTSLVERTLRTGGFFGTSTASASCAKQSEANASSVRRSGASGASEGAASWWVRKWGVLGKSRLETRASHVVSFGSAVVAI